MHVQVYVCAVQLFYVSVAITDLVCVKTESETMYIVQYILPGSC